MGRLMNFLRMLLLCTVVAMLGCGSGPGSDSEAVTPPTVQPADQAKAVLENVAQTGELGSGIGELRPLFEQIKATDAAKGDALLSDLTALESSTSPDAAKAKAKEMLGKL